MLKLPLIYFAKRKITNINSLLIKSLIILSTLIVSFSSIGLASIASATTNSCTFGTPVTEVQPNSMYIFIGNGVTSPYTKPQYILTQNGTIADKCGQKFTPYTGAAEQTYPDWFWNYRGVSLEYGGFTHLGVNGLVQGVIPPTGTGYGIMSDLNTKATSTTPAVNYPSSSYYVKCLQYTLNPNTSKQAVQYVRFDPSNYQWVNSNSSCQ
jgi:hypothetical protein